MKRRIEGRRIINSSRRRMHEEDEDLRRGRSRIRKGGEEGKKKELY